MDEAQRNMKALSGITFDDIVQNRTGEDVYFYRSAKKDEPSGYEKAASSATAYSYETLTSKPDMNLTDIDDVVAIPHPTGRQRKAAVDKALKNASVVGRIGEDKSVKVFVDDIGTEVTLSRKGVAHGLDRRFSENLPATLKAGEILKNSIRVNELTPSRKDVDDSYVLIGAAKHRSGNVSVVRFVVNRFSYEISSVDVLHAINAKKEPAVLNAPPLTNDSLRITDSTISMAELLDYVNKYFPDILPEGVLRHYGHTERPAGKLGEGALFSISNDRNRDNTDSNVNADPISAKMYASAKNIFERLGFRVIDAVNPAVHAPENTDG